MANLEIEIKFHLENPGLTRTSIVKLGASSLGRFFETNHVLDDSSQTLFKKKALLRLRQADGVLLTFKSPAPGKIDSDFKIRRESEIQVNDFATARQILKKLGFKTVRIYEKWRETFTLQGTHLCLDTLPYGDFLEIEGPKTAIQDLAGKLGFAWPQRSILNYHELFELVKTELKLPFTDITFANFKGIAVDIRNIKYRFEAGS